MQTKNRGSVFFLGILVVLFLWVRLPYLADSIWHDEAFTIHVASLPLAEIPEELYHDNAAPLHYVLLHYWMQLWGTSEVAVRSLSLLFSILTFALLFWGMRSIAGKRTAFLAGLLITLAPSQVYYAQETRPYALAQFLALCSTILLWKLLFHTPKKLRFPNETWTYSTLLGISNGLLLLTHYWGAFLIAVEILIVGIWLIRSGQREKIRTASFFLLSLLITALLFAPWLSTFLHQLSGDPLAWLEEKNPYILVFRSLKHFTFDEKGLVFWGIIIATWLISVSKRTSHYFFLALGILPLIIAQTASLYSPLYMVNRYDTIVLPIFLASWALLLDAVTRHLALLPASFSKHEHTERKQHFWSILFLTISTGVLISSAAQSLITLYSKPKAVDRLVAHYIIDHTTPDDLVIFTYHTSTPFEYYAQHYPQPPQRINFPTWTKPQEGFVNLPALLPYRELVTQNAQLLANLCQSYQRNNHSCTIVYFHEDATDPTKEINPTIRQAFDKTIGSPTREVTLAARLAFYRETLYVYEPPIPQIPYAPPVAD